MWGRSSHHPCISLCTYAYNRCWGYGMKRQLLANSSNISNPPNSGATEVLECTSKPNYEWCKLSPAPSQVLFTCTYLSAGSLEKRCWCLCFPIAGGLAPVCVEQSWEGSTAPGMGLLWAELSAVGSKSWWRPQLSLCWGHLLLSPGRPTKWRNPLLCRVTLWFPVRSESCSCKEHAVMVWLLTEKFSS